MAHGITPQEFVHKWRSSTLTERASSQSHFNDLCDLIGHPRPAEADPHGEWFAFEKGATKTSGGQGWADVWKRGCFAWEYKGKHADLDKAYRQLQTYSGSLDNPPLLIVSDIDTIRIQTQFTNRVQRKIVILLDELVNPEKLDILRKAFSEPEALQSEVTRVQVTDRAARRFAEIAQLQRRYGHDPHEVAHFLIRLLFCLFAEDVELLPAGLFSKLLQTAKAATFPTQLRQLFAAMAEGGFFGSEAIAHVDGGLFNDDRVLPMDGDSLRILREVSSQDWAAIEPAIFGTLFERGLDPDKRSQLGAHFTSRDDILLIVEPVLMAPLRARWQQVRAEALAIGAELEKLDADAGQDTSPAARQKRRTARTKAGNRLDGLLLGFREELAAVQVLDPACGSGNFLYVALRLLLDLEKEVISLGASLGGTIALPLVSPSQLHGIEVNAYAHELAQATIWIGYIQWRRENGFGLPEEPILKPLETVRRMDAILAHDAEGQAVEPKWPAADVIIGNPPFLGGNKIRQGMGDKYVDDLFSLYGGRVPAFSDLVCYWFEKARATIERDPKRRAGLLATQAIRGGVNRTVLERIKHTGDIFWAYSDRDWILDGATVHVSMIGFDGGLIVGRKLDGKDATSINANLTTSTDVTQASKLVENLCLCFIGSKKAGAFDLDLETARHLLDAPVNPNDRPNSDVVLPWVNGIMLTNRGSTREIIYFAELSEADSALYEAPFELVRKLVYAERQTNNEERARVKWWQHRRPAADMWAATNRGSRFIATPRVSKHRLFVWVKAGTLPDDGVYVFAREDDYFFGVLHSHLHELWARATGTQLREAESGFRYTPTTTFETYPFPWPPGKEPDADPRVEAIAAAARELVAKRDAWLNPPGASEAELKKRTLTNLYNQRPTWLRMLHRRLDEAVLDAYGWPHDLSDEELLARLLALNLERAGKGGAA